VLHVCQPVDGGVARYVADVCADQLSRGWQVGLACPSSELARQLGTDADWWCWPATRSPDLVTLAQIASLARIVADVAPDVVHLHSAKAGLAGRLTLRGHRPTIFSPHGWSWLAVSGATAKLTVRWERLAARWTQLLVCVGREEYERGLAVGIDAPMSVVRNGVDLGVFVPATDADRSAARARLNLDNDAPLVVCPGRVTQQKGQDVLLAAWPRIRAACPTARLAIVGDGDPSLLTGLRTAHHGNDGTDFAPATSDIRPWLAAADVIALPSRWEGLPLVALEAAATGRAIVASAVGGLPEVVNPDMGALVPPEDPEALADALVARLRDPQRLRREGTAAAAAAGKFDQRNTLEQLAVLTSSLAQTHARATRNRA
jgi:glycosyltransferase involved in cell wall biosynthesis